MISIVIPTYNGSRFLAQTLESAVNQTFKDKEIIVVDDCSKDYTLKIASKFEVTIIQNKERLGPVANWNSCFKVAKGQWIKFLHQDDLLEPNCLYLMESAARRYPNRKLIACKRNLEFEGHVKEGGQEKWRRFINYSSISWHFAENCYEGWDIGPRDFARFMAKHPTINAIGEPSSVMIHRDSFKALGGFNERLIQLVDWEYFARIAVWKGLVYLNTKLATYRVHRRSVTASNVANRLMQVQWRDPAFIIKELAESKHYHKVRAAADPHDFAEQYREMTTLHVLR